MFLVGPLTSCSIYSAHQVEEPLCNLNNTPESDSIPLNTDYSVKEVRVYGCNPWNSSGITVQKNQRYEIKLKEGPTGTVNWVDGDVISDPVDGWKGFYNNFKGWFIQSYKRSDHTNWYAVTGSVSKDDDCTFSVLSKFPEEAAVTIPRNGTLYFFANDMKGRYFNNHGYAVLEIKRIQDADEGANQTICND